MKGVQLVVARYMEPIDWVYEFLFLQYVDTIVIYDKSPPEYACISKDPRVVVHLLENVGREAHTYLHHIVITLTTQADTPHTIVFTQGHYNDHLDRKTFENMLLAGQNPLPRVGLDIPWNCTAMEHFHWSVENNHDPSSQMNPANMTIGSFYTKYIGTRLPPQESVVWWQNAIFCIRTETLRKIPRETFLQLRHLLSVGSNPELAHYMERCWHDLFIFSEE
jgi:hypothetical protein